MMRAIALLIQILIVQAPLPTGSFYELTWNALPARGQFPTLPPLTYANTTIFGAKIGDRTRDVEFRFGPLTSARILENEYLTAHCENSLFVYTSKSNGQLVRFEVFEKFAPFIADTRLKELLGQGDLELMRLIFGPDDRVEVKSDEHSMEYRYERRGISFVKYTIDDRTVNALRFYKISE